MDSRLKSIIEEVAEKKERLAEEARIKAEEAEIAAEIIRNEETKSATIWVEDEFFKIVKEDALKGENSFAISDHYPYYDLCRKAHASAAILAHEISKIDGIKVKSEYIKESYSPDEPSCPSHFIYIISW